MTSERQTICFLMKQLMSQNWKFPVFLTLRALLISATTFCTVLFSSSILEKIQSGSVKELLIVFVVVWLAVLLLLQLIQAVLDYWVETRKRSLIEEQNSRIDRQSMKREFEWLGDFGVQEKMREQDEYTNMTGGVLKVFVTLWEKGAKAVFDIFFAVVLMLVPFWQNRMGKHVWYGILLAAIVLVSSLINQRLQKKLNEATKQYFQDCIEGNSISVYYLYNILFGYETGKDLRIFKQERFILNGIQKAIDIYAAAGRKYATVCRKKKYVTVTISAVSSGLVFLCVGTQAYFGTIGVGDILRIAGGISGFTVGIAAIFDVLSETTLLQEYARKFLDLLKNEEREEKPSVLANQVECPILECKNVHFQYPGTTVDILKGINLTIRKGERIALVGRNGSGKTTLIKILCGLYHATKGTIQWKGIDNREVASEQYFKEFACVFQDYTLFAFPVDENVAASERFDRIGVESALDKVGLMKRMAECQEGIHTSIGKEISEKGIDFSGGERQKIAIARAIYKKAKIQIMDEPTASLDPVSEVEIYRDFDQMIAYDAAIYISHRLASCKFCDRIYVMEDGRIMEEGDHRELLEKRGIYHDMWQAQIERYRS